MIKFFPIWITPAGSLPSVTENDVVSFSLQAVRSATFMGENDQSDIVIGSNANAITNVYVNTISQNGWSVAGDTLILANAVSSTDVVRVDTSEAISFSLLHDSLPPGLGLSNAGVISGTVARLPTDGSSLDYAFAVRISDGVAARDRQFDILANTTTVAIDPPSWGRIPAEVLNVNAQPTPFRYVPLGSATRGSEFEFQIDIFRPGGVSVHLLLESYFGSSNIQAPFTTLPLNLTLDPTTGIVSGTVDPSVALGQYFFKVQIQDNRGNNITVGQGATPKIFMIDVTPPNLLEPLRFIEWATSAGLLGTVYENQTFPGSVSASCTTGEPVTYTLAANTPLPDGLTLNTTTGEIEGIVGHIVADTVFTFTIRAAVGDTFSDRSFSINTLSRYTTGNVVNVYFKLRSDDLVPMMSYYPTVINEGEFFRPDDPNFGTISADLTIYVVGGVGATSDQFKTAIRSSSYGGPVTLYLGPHKIAYAKLGTTTVYEVLYREVFDPQTGASFTVSYNPQSFPAGPARNPPVYVYPNSITNIRQDFVNRIGFPTIDPSLTNVLGGAGENMPLWMTSPQVGSDASSALGFVPALVLAYLAPGYGQIVLNRIAAYSAPAERPIERSNPLAVGHEVDFDQYYTLIQSTTPQTTFYYDDANPIQLSFDNGLTIFDQFVTYEGKYFRINPQIGRPS